MLRMPNRLKKKYDLLFDEIGALHLKWEEYIALFGADEATIDLLNDVAHRFFYMTEQALWADMLLHLSRITGPTTSGRGKKQQKNLTIQLLPDLVKKDKRMLVEGVVKAAVDASSFVTLARNKVLAHQDLQVALNPPALSKLNLGSRHQMTNALALLVATLDGVTRAYDDAPHMFDWNDDSASSTALLRRLRR